MLAVRTAHVVFTQSFVDRFTLQLTVHHGEAREDVGACAVPQPDDVLDPQLVQHSHQVLADLQWGMIAKITKNGIQDCGSMAKITKNFIQNRNVIKDSLL